MIGQTISHYKILAKLGEGGMGIVYKAQDLKLNRTVALKFLPMALTSDSEAVNRFINEAQTASALDHANICTIHEIDETEDGRIFICMAYYDGETLRKKVASGQLSVNSAIDIAIQIANGLARAHEAGVIHRDIKPENIIITRRGEVKIIDFGIAKLAGQSRLTKIGATLGTMMYMSPEQLHGKEVDYRADIWALGVVLYVMLAGQAPFWGEQYNRKFADILAVQEEIANEISQQLRLKLSGEERKRLTKRYTENTEAYQLYLKGRYYANKFTKEGFDTGIEYLRQAIAMDPSYWLAHLFLGRVYEQKGRLAEAIEEFQQARRIEDAIPEILAALGHAYAVSGRKAEAQSLIEELQERSKQGYVSSYNLATTYIGLGEKDHAFEWLEKAHTERSFYLTWLTVNPELDSLRADARFLALLKKMELKP